MKKDQRLKTPKDHRRDACATEVLAGPEYFDCGPMKARISARQCLLNQGKADGMKIFGTRYMGKEVVCLSCPEGRQMKVYPPRVFSLPQPSEEALRVLGYLAEVDPAPKEYVSTLDMKGLSPEAIARGKEAIRSLCASHYAASEPSAIRTQAGTPAPLSATEPKKKKLPAWLKDASAAVRRDYLKGRGG